MIAKENPVAAVEIPSGALRRAAVNVLLHALSEVALFEG